MRLAFVLFLSLFLFACAPKVVQKAVVIPGQEKERATEVVHGDTVSYVIAFRDAAERGKFITDFEGFIKSFPYEKLPADSSGIALRFRLLPSEPRPGDTAQSGGPAVELEQPPAGQPAAEIFYPGIDTSACAPGGSVSLYLFRGDMDETMLRLLSPRCVAPACSVSGDGRRAEAPWLSMEYSAPKRIKITLAGTVVNAAGQQLSAFDIIGQWNAFVKEHPAEGKGLFRYVKGLDGYLKGREAVISGMQAGDDKTIVLTLDQPDSVALLRLLAPRLYPPSLKLGPFAAVGPVNGQVNLDANRRYPGSKVCLDKCAVKLDNDNNPLLGFSLNRYSFATLFSLQDIDYARTRLRDNTVCVPFDQPRYFLALGALNPEIRQYLARLTNPRDVLASAVKAEGRILSAIEQNDTGFTAGNDGSRMLQPPPLDKPLFLIFRRDDPISVLIADKVLADLSRVNVPCTLQPLDGTAYEQALVRRDWAIAVGWVAGSVSESRTERLRLAALWFNDEINEAQRLRDAWEIPLFSVSVYAAIKKNIGFSGGLLSGMFVKR